MDLIYEGITTSESLLSFLPPFSSQNGPDLRRDYDDPTKRHIRGQAPGQNGPDLRRDYDPRWKCARGTSALVRMDLIYEGITTGYLALLKTPYLSEWT